MEAFSEPELRKLPVDLETIVEFATEDDEAFDESYARSAHVDTETGEVHIVYRRAFACTHGEVEREELEEWETEGIEIAEKILAATGDRYVEIERWHSSESYALMEAFASAVGNEGIRQRLLHVLRGRKPFRSFREALFEWPELREKWFLYLNHQQREQAREWLRAYGIEAVDASLSILAPLPDQW